MEMMIFFLKHMHVCRACVEPGDGVQDQIGMEIFHLQLAALKWGSCDLQGESRMSFMVQHLHPRVFFFFLPSLSLLFLPLK